MKVSFGFSSISEVKKNFFCYCYWLYIWYFFFFFWLWDLSSPPIHPAMKTWSPNHWTAKGFSCGYFLKEEWMIHIHNKNSHIHYNSYTIPFYWSWFFTCGLEKKERNGKQLQFTYCWLFPTGWLWSRCYCPNFTDEETEAPRRELP